MLGRRQYMRVFRATGPASPKREVVLKFPKPRPGLDALLRAALLREMWIASHVRSPFVTESLEPPTERRSCLYGVLPYYAGETLETAAACVGHRIALAAGLEIALKLTKAVAALHRAGIIHRDIKPENIMLEPDGGLKLIDLGVARLRRFDEGESLEVPGTRSYMAPELFAGTPADESSDIFALGVTLYRMFTGGAYPYGEVEAFAQPRLGKATALAKLRPDLPAWLDRTIARAIAIDRRERFADAIEFGFELEHGSLRAIPHAIERAVALRPAIRRASGRWLRRCCSSRCWSRSRIWTEAQAAKHLHRVESARAPPRRVSVQHAAKQRLARRKNT